MGSQIERSELAWSRISPALEGLNTFEEKKNYIDTHEYISKAMELLPEFKEKVNSHMLQDIVTEFSNPDAQGFTFSKTYSDEFLLDKLNLIEKNQEVMKNYFGGEEGIKKLEESAKEKNAAYLEAKGTVTNLKEAIRLKRKEFDERSEAFGGPAGVFTVPLQFFGKPVTQALIGWTDWWRDPGLEKVEMRMADWDPIHKRYGPGPEIPALQEKLREAYEEKTETVPQQYVKQTAKFKEYNDMVLSDASNRAIVESTGLDEALHYLDMESLKSMLQGE